ncbi:hypothetical protein HPB48_025578 [Haemaphysalis longicornis]|uniref:Ubiquitin carboxyl-terminal hydrolase 32 n=1 Tax=Haemaphysalis longicornis TaxID=44386 RepID=A0A9J6HA54_HAELO|nr:hypothetical protein HPB48_025578 [Haemaphysalis longicornis]
MPFGAEVPHYAPKHSSRPPPPKLRPRAPTNQFPPPVAPSDLQSFQRAPVPPALPHAGLNGGMSPLAVGADKGGAQGSKRPLYPSSGEEGLEGEAAGGQYATGGLVGTVVGAGFLPVENAAMGGGKNVNFAMPKVATQPKSRTRSRSMSTPQSSTKGAPTAAATASTKQAASLSQLPRVSSPPQRLTPKLSVSVSSLPGSVPSNSVSPPLQQQQQQQQSAVLTQLLTSGNSFSWEAQPATAASPIAHSTGTASTPATVTIINSVAPSLPVTATQPQTFVISPSRCLRTNNLQRNLIVGSASIMPSSVSIIPSKQLNATVSTTVVPQAKAADVPVASASASPAKPFRPKSDEERVQYKEHRRVCHINAEQKRRFNIKNGFESLRHLLPSLSQNPDSKVSKAQMLQQGSVPSLLFPPSVGLAVRSRDATVVFLLPFLAAGEYIRALKNERQQQQEEADRLKKQIESFNQAISLYQNQLPATGVPLPCQRTNHLRESFEEYVRGRTLQNWKFWIVSLFSLLLEPLLESYNQTVSKAGVDEMCKTVLVWVEQNCSLRALRPGVLDSLRYLSTSTNILSDPSRLPEEAMQAVTKKESMPHLGCLATCHISPSLSFFPPHSSFIRVWMLYDHVTESELKRLRDAFKRASNLSGIITRQAFIKEVLGEFVPLKLAEHIFQACGGTSKGITFKDLLCGLVLLTRGTREERIRFIFNLYANEGGTHIYKNDMIKLICGLGLPSGGVVVSNDHSCPPLQSEKVTFEEFQEWLLQHPDATSLTRWLLNEPSSVTLSNDLETPTFYQTLAGVTHLEETDIIELEKRYWQLKTQSRTGRFDLDMLGPLISPPVPPVLCQGIFNAFDENRDNHIDFKEMACGVSACCRGPLAERQKFCFKVFDQDMDGMLSREEVSHMLTLLMVLQQEERSDELFQMQMAPARPDVGPLIDEVFDKHDPGKTGVITLDEYLVWTVGNNLTISLLNLMFQVCHVVFGLRPSSREEEGDIVRSWLRREERRGLKPGQMLYLISMDWWRSWNDYVDCKLQAAGSSAASCGVSGVKVTSRLQRKVESSVARSATDDGSVVLASVTSLAPDGHHLLDPVTPFEAAVNCPSVPGSPKCPRLSATLQCPESSCPSSLNPSPSVSRKVVPTFVQRPPSIDNTGLVAPSTVKVSAAALSSFCTVDLQGVMHRGRDFEAVPEAVWRALFQWYGGSPALPRQCIVRGGTGAGHHPASTELELYPPCLRLWRHQPPQGAVGGARQQNANSWTAVVGSVASAYVGGVGPGGGSQASGGSASPKRFLAYQASFSRTSTLRQVFDFLCTRLRLRPEDTRLWQLQDENNLTPLEEESLTLEQLGIEDGEQILIEVRNKDQTWPEEMSCIINSKIDQKNQGPTEKGATGLNNLGNTCFMNAALQCVSNTRPLTQYFINEKHLYELNRSVRDHLVITASVRVTGGCWLLHSQWTIGKYAPRFNGFQQHDSQELLAFLLDGLHEDLNRVQEKPYVELKDSAGRPDDEVAREAWENHALRNRSVVVDLFHGQLQSTVTCKVCGHTSVRFDPFNFLSLPLPMESCVHVEVVVVRLDGSVPVRYGLQLNPDERYASLKQQLAPLCGLCPQQLLLAEVWGAVVRALLPDDRRVQATTGGAGLYAYQLLQASDHSSSAAPSADDEGSGSCWAPPHVREPQTLTQIQRMVVTCANGPQLPSGGKPLVNGSLPSGDGGPSSLCGPPPLELGVVAAAGGAGEASSCQVTTVGLFCCSRLGGSRCGPRPLSRVGQGNDGLPERPDTPGSTSSGSAVTSGSWNGVGPYAELSSGMSSSLTSNCSAADLSDLPRRNFVVAYHRKMMRQDVYFLSSQKTRPTLFGLPLVLPCHEGTSRQDLYRLVWTQVARLVSPLPPSEATVPNHAQDCDDSLGYEYPFTLKAVHKDGFMCAWCPWYKFCRGCPIDCDDADFNFSSLYLSIDWDPTALHLRYQASQERVYVDHPSVERTRQQKVEPISVHDCLAAFTKEEQLGDREKYHCSRCKQHQLATKKLQIYRLPPILIIHLKRFQLLGGKWVNSASAAAGSLPRNGTPLANGDVADAGGGGEPQDHHKHRLHPGYSPLDLKYQMYALACHTGILGGGHYVSYACNPNNKWYCYNDSSCKEVQLDQIDSDSAYMLFYEREGINYEAYMPNTEGKVPDARDIDDEFESDFRKMCVLQ